ncbi:MAG: thioesterase family protein [Chitinophagaceae bacterium]|nr:thioesterase family protein [Chitinophagaceae bacterium]
MARIRINTPAAYSFSCSIPVRITDINYGGHVGNDTVLSIIHEARMQYFRALGYTELNLAGAGLIMADVAIEFKAELFYGDVVTASLTAADFSTIGFDLLYKLEVEREDKTLAALAKTGMVCYDYNRKKIVAVPEEAKLKMQQ